MYMGHLAVGLAAKKSAPAVPIVALVVAPIASDLGDVVLGIAGVEHSWYYTHTVLGAVALAVVAGMIGLALYGRVGLVLAALAATHVPLDYLTSQLAVTPSGPTIGLGLYAQPIIDLAMESIVAIAGWWIYRSSIAPERRNHGSVIAIPLVLVLFQAVWTMMIS